ncbi:hypothetical protein VHUM_02712 [Vanrija humicola]|uniref:Major facilitator superfamily (MFS) profile domain-containing protein n=1 Tax=Vanrija humicola TaxID=5417 RepID=A0A7D8YYR1_VANHU|nr:hypothetical protein VHUM_02712 [Vanrija humicola]
MSSTQQNPLAHLRNNTSPWWWKDKGLRSLALGIAVGFSSSVSTGYDGAVMTGLQANKLFMAAIDHPSPTMLGTIIAAQGLGAIPGFIPAAYVTDRFGRCAALAAGYIIIIIGALIQAFTTGGWKMFGGRLILGFGGTFVAVAGGPYTTEIAHPRNRAQTTALIQTCFYMGSVVAAWVCFGAVYMRGTNWGWRMCLLFQVVVPLMALVAIPFIPESPRWLVSKDRVEEAHDMLAKYRANGDKSDEMVVYELQEIQEAIEQERAAKAVTFATFIKTKGNRRRLAIILTVAFTSQWAGNGVISFYLVSILRSIGITNAVQQTGYNAGLQVFNWVFAIFGALVCERFGRRKMWLTSAIGMFFSYVVITACSAAYANGHAPAGKAVMGMLFIYFFFYDIGYTGLTLAYPLEILPFALRSKGVAILFLCIMLSATFNTYVNPIALHSIAWRYYFVFLGVLLVAITLIYFIFPETKGRMLEEIAVIFDGEEATLHAQTNLREERDGKQIPSPTVTEIKDIHDDNDRRV